MEAGTSTAPRGDIFDRIGDFVGNSVRDGARRIVDYATVTNPSVGIVRAATDPEGTRDSVRRVGNDAFNALSLLVPGLGAARLILGTEEGRRAAEQGAKGAVDAATLGNPLFAAGRAIVDPDGTRDTYERAGKAVKDFVESPFTTYGMAKRAYEFAREHPEAVKHAAEVGFDIATVTNPVLAAGRGIVEGFKGLFGGD